jgi:hypothetical protein
MRRLRFCSALLLSLLLFGAGSLELPPALGQTRTGVRMAVIVSSQSSLRDVSRALLRRIFLGEPAEHDGKRFVPLNYAPSDPLRTGFDRLALNFSAEQAGRYWIDRRIRGQGLPPRAVSSQTLLRNVVARLPGGIGYVTLDQLNASVRALTIDGKGYEDPGYPLLLDVR